MVPGGGVDQGKVQRPHGFAVCCMIDSAPALVETREIPRFHMAALSAPDLRRRPIELFVVWPKAVERDEYDVVCLFEGGVHRPGDCAATRMANDVDCVRFV